MEAVACFVIRGNRNRLNQLVEEIQKDKALKLVLAKFGPSSDYFLVKRLREGERLNDFESK
jgi:hypothetical protein